MLWRWYTSWTEAIPWGIVLEQGRGLKGFRARHCRNIVLRLAWRPFQPLVIPVREPQDASSPGFPSKRRVIDRQLRWRGSAPAPSNPPEYDPKKVYTALSVSSPQSVPQSAKATERDGPPRLSCRRSRRGQAKRMFEKGADPTECDALTKLAEGLVSTQLFPGSQGAYESIEH